MVFSLNSWTTFLNHLPTFVHFLIAVMALSLQLFYTACLLLSCDSGDSCLSLRDRENSFIWGTNGADSQYESYLSVAGDVWIRTHPRKRLFSRMPCSISCRGCLAILCMITCERPDKSAQSLCEQIFQAQLMT